MTGSTAVPPIVELSGTPREIGLGHGEALRTPIREVLDIYREVLQLSPAATTEHGTRLRSTIAAFDPEIVEELDGIAAGAGVAPADVYVLNGRSELMGELRDGCTTVHVPSAGLLGQTWDWLDLFESRMVLLRVRRRGGPTFVTLTEPGIAAKLGCNSRGIGVALNFMYADGPLLGVPIHVLLRRLLGAASEDDASEVLARAGAGRAGSVHVASGRGWGRAVEYLGDATHEVDVATDVDGTALIHTNHSVHDPRSGGVWLDNSSARLARTRDLVDAETLRTVGELFAVLGDRDGEHPICAAYLPFGPVGIGTVAAVVSDLRRSTLFVRMGPDPTAPITAVPVG